MATQSTTSGAPILNIGKSINTTPATPQQNQAFAPPAVNQPSSGGSVWSGVGSLLSSFLAGGAPQVAGTNQTTPGGSTPPNVGTMAQPLPSTGTPKSDPTAQAPSQPASNPFIPTANAQTSTPTLGGGGVKAPQGMEYGPTGQLQPTSTNSGVAQYTTPDQTQTPNSGFQTVTGPNGALEAVPNGSSLDAQGNIVKNSPNVNVGGDTSNSGNDRFSQLNAIIQNLQSAGNITPEEQALKDQLATQEADTSLGLAHIAGTPEGMFLQTGQSNVLQQQGLAKANLLTNQIANLQAQRQAKLQSGTAAAGAEQALQGFQQPVSVSPGNALISPFTGQQVGGNATLDQLSGNGSIQTLAQQVISGQLSPEDAQSKLSQYGSAGALALNQAIQKIKPGFNFNAASGSSSAQQSNAKIGGTAGVTAAQSVFNQAYGAYNQLQNSVQNIDQFGGLLTQTMTAGGINPTDSKYANQSIASVRNQLSSAQQAVFDNTLASLRSRVSGLLSAGGNEIPSAITSDAQKILDGSLPLTSLNAVLGRIQQEGQVLLQNQGKIVNDNYSKLQGGNSSSQPTTSNANQPAGWF